MKELFVEQDLLKKINGGCMTDNQTKLEINNLMQQLQEISYQVGKFKNSNYS